MSEEKDLRANNDSYKKPNVNKEYVKKENFKKEYAKKEYVAKSQKKVYVKKEYSKKEELPELVVRRNKRLSEFFKLLGLNVKIIGNVNNPPMTINDEFILNAYVHNFELRFTDNPNQGNVIYVVKLTEKPLFDKNKVLSAINDYEKRPVFKVYLQDCTPTLYISGYNFLNKEEKLGRYPLFSAYSPRVYFSKEKADEIYNELKSDGYSASVC
jgi:hypothetical protein